MKQIRILLACSLILWLALPVASKAQNGRTTGQNKNFVSTGMPILLISPDAVSSALGDAGVASLPDFACKFAGGTIGGYRINKRSAAAASLTYFSLGEIQSTDITGQPIGVMNPNEFAFDLTYAMKLNDELSIGASGRFIQSDLTNGQILSDGSSYVTTKPARSIAADLGLYWQHPIDREQDIALGAFISNMGAKLSYTNDDTRKEFLPTNLRVGGRYTTQLDAYNELTVLLDFNKLLVPTPPISDTSQNKYYKDRTEYYQTGVMRGAIQSFYDAPGGLTEELNEIQISAGAEYWYKQTLAARMGYFYESYAKGGRQYATFGFALRYSIMQFDLSYIVPTTNFSSNPLTNTIRISLTINLKHTKNSPVES